MIKKNRKLILISLILMTIIFSIVSVFLFNFSIKSLSKRYSIDLNVKTVIDNYNENNYSYSFDKYLKKNKEEVENQKNEIDKTISEIEKKYNIKAENKNYLLSSSFSANLSDIEYELLKNDLKVKRVYSQENLKIVKESDDTNKSGYTPLSTDVLDKINSDTGIFKTTQENSGQNTLISIVDTGFDLEHYFFNRNVENPLILDNTYYLDLPLTNGYKKYYVSSKIPYAYDYIEGNNIITSDNKHGTHVAAIAAGNASDFKGSAFNAQLALFKIGDKTGTEIGVIGNENRVDEIIRQTITDAIVIGSNVINLSLGVIGSIQASAAYEDIFLRAEQAGVIIVCAAGNSGGIRNTGQNIENSNSELIYNYSSKDYIDENTISTPASSNYAIAVGSVYKNQLKKSITSSHGVLQNLDIKPDLIAPGVDIKSASAKTNKTMLLSGTSMASPNLAGQIAVYMSYMKKNKDKFPKFKSNQEMVIFIKNILFSNANAIKVKDSTKTYNYLSPVYQGNGLIDVNKTIKSSVYFSVDNEKDNNLPKIKLMQNPFNKNKFNFTFSIHNISNETKKFKTSIYLTVPEFLDDGRLTGFNTEINSDYKLINNKIEIDKNLIEVESNKKDDNNFKNVITGSIDINNIETEKILKEFKNGTYINGYILITEIESGEIYTIPMIGYYDNNSDIKAFQRNIMYQETGNNKSLNVGSYFKPTKDLQNSKYNYPSLYVNGEDLGSIRYSYKNSISKIEQDIQDMTKINPANPIYLNSKKYNYIYDSREHSSIKKGVLVKQIHYPVFRNIQKINSLDVIYNFGWENSYIDNFNDGFNIPSKYALMDILYEDYSNLVKTKNINLNLNKFASLNNSFFDFYFDYTLDDSFKGDNSQKIEKLRRIKIDNQKPIALSAKKIGDQLDIVYEENDKLFKIDIYYDDNGQDGIYSIYVDNYDKVSDVNNIKVRIYPYKIKSFTLYDYAGNSQKYNFNDVDTISYDSEQITSDYLNNSKILEIEEANKSNYIDRSNKTIDLLYYKNISDNLYEDIKSNNETFIYNGVRYFKLKHINGFAAVELINKTSETISLLEGAKLIATDFINDDNNVKTIILPSTLEYIDNLAFTNVSTLKNIYFKSEKAPVFIGDPFAEKTGLKMFIPRNSYGYKSKGYRKVFSDFEYKNINIFISNQRNYIPNFMQDIDSMYKPSYLNLLTQIKNKNEVRYLSNNINFNDINNFTNNKYFIDFENVKIENQILTNENNVSLQTGDLVYIKQSENYVLNNNEIYGFVTLNSTYINLEKENKFVLSTYFNTKEHKDDKYENKVYKFTTLEEEKEFLKGKINEIIENYNKYKISVSFYKDKEFNEGFDVNNNLSYKNVKETTNIYMKRDFKLYNLKLLNTKNNEFENIILDQKIENPLSFEEIKNIFKGLDTNSISLNDKTFSIEEFYSYIFENYNNSVNDINIKADVKYAEYNLIYKIDNKEYKTKFNKKTQTFIPVNSNKKFLHWIVDQDKNNKKIVNNIVQYAIDNNLKNIEAEAIFEDNVVIDNSESDKPQTKKAINFLKLIYFSKYAYSVTGNIIAVIVYLCVRISQKRRKKRKQNK